MIPLILASGSIWRKRLLARNGYKTKVCISDFKERKRGMPPEELVLYNAEGKARVISQQIGNEAIVIGVDTIGVVENSILGKPDDELHARRMLMRLSGTTHRVITGLWLINTKTGQERHEAVTTFITFKKVDESKLDLYLASGQWKGKAGSYAIQGRAKGFVEKIDGSLSNVVGLPIERLQVLLKELE